MRRLILLMALPASALAGCAAGLAFDQLLAQPLLEGLSSLLSNSPNSNSKGPKKEGKEGRKGSNSKGRISTPSLWNQPVMLAARLLCGLVLGNQLRPHVAEFEQFCEDKAHWSLSHPQIVTKARNGALIDDYRESYLWLKANTPEDARVMAWWDYGYQIAGIANRTTIADGNTWNHEHIALLGLCLSSPANEAHAIARHLADYILVWAGGGGKDDVGKSKHMARIANSVYRGHCAEDDCDQYGIFPDGRPSKMMGESLVYGLCGRAELDSQLFKEVYVSSNQRVRIVKVQQVSAKSRSWAADPNNRLCESPGSWYCPGRYPPGLNALFNRTDKALSRVAQAYQTAYDARIKEQLKDRPEPNGEGLPDGSYLGSCRGCRLTSKDVLACSHCRLPGSPSMASSLDLSTCWILEVNNIHGQLQCEPKPNDVAIPAGRYQQSCKGCELRNRLLACSHCSTAAGRQVPSTFSPELCPPPGVLDNDNGKLVCSGLPNAAAVPDGPYLQSCQGCQVTNTPPSVQCRLCRRADGQQVGVSMTCLPQSYHFGAQSIKLKDGRARV